MQGIAESIDPLGGLWSMLAVQLRELRKRHGLSQAAVGRLVNVDHKTVSNWEAGRNHPPVDALRTLDEEWKTGQLLECIHHYANTMQAPARFLAVVEYEAMADVIRMNGVAFIPGLLQTPEYAREVFTMAGIADVEGQVARRIERQAVLTRENPPYVSILLSEVAIRLIPPALREGQLRRLLEVAELPHVTLRIFTLEAGLQVGLDGEFYLFSTPHREVGFVETAARGRLVTESDDLRTLAVAFDRTSGRALSPEATRDRLLEMIEG
ncbi:helix-turn-helix transcriptional regulator [Actinomadura barringtoniae]|uniref:Helix-turn-helix transcriptional regulator n=1 Tax=Actinomadura barringtoniae TaxID=1427535 RepID=A0A939PVA9_9ACTN|nr:helix-turn-helix transcriptional regulator [Actinomadura barringtoniae]MBO2455674.1 helix-turn-helix transcriptional regulator [Actinomadura barringtoniae]